MRKERLLENEKYRQVKIVYILLIALLPGLLSFCEVDAVKNNSKKKIQNSCDDCIDNSNMNLDIYLLIGQSNMAGRAPIESDDLDTLDNVFLYVGSDSIVWERAANPLNKYSSIRKELTMQKLGPGYTFAKEIAYNYSDKQIGLVVNAKGGVSIDLWNPDSEFYNEAVRRTNKALEFGVLKGIIWHQGESDATNYKQYMPKLTELIQSLRKDFNLPHLPFVVGQLSGDKAFREDFNKMILNLPEQVDYTGVVKSDSTRTIDGTHFDSDSQHLIGRRYAIEMVRLLKRE